MGFNPFKAVKKAVKKLTALIKETGFMSIPKEPFPIMDDVADYTKSTIKIT